jgi:hypothetical protein
MSSMGFSKVSISNSLVVLAIMTIIISCSPTQYRHFERTKSENPASEYEKWMATNKAQIQRFNEEREERSRIIKEFPKLLFNCVHSLSSTGECATSNELCIYELSSICDDPNYKPVTRKELEMSGIPTCVDNSYGAHESGPLVLALRYKERLTIVGYANKYKLVHYKMNEYCLSKECSFGMHRCFIEHIYYYEMGSECDTWSCPRPGM